MKAILLACVMAGLAIGQGRLGIGVMRVEAGVEVTSVTKGSPAEDAGLKVGDVITQFNGLRVVTNEQLGQMVLDTPPGRQVRLQVYRSGAPQIIVARIAPPPTPVSLAGGIPGTGGPRVQDVPQSFPGWLSPVLGVEVEDLQPGQFAAYFGVTEGVLVHSVTSGSAAERAGIKAGDVIMGLGSTKVTTALEITNRLQMMTGNSLGMALMRDRQPVSLTVTFELPCQPAQRGPAQAPCDRGTN